MKRAFSLIEVLLSLVILVLGIVFVLNLFPLAWQSLSYSRKLNEISFFARNKLDELKTQESITPGETLGKQGDLNWKISLQPLKLADGIEVISAQLDVDTNFSGKRETQRFITYLYKE